jgi:2-oxoisovalerate dehydrogenase E1 component
VGILLKESLVPRFILEFWESDDGDLLGFHSDFLLTLLFTMTFITRFEKRLIKLQQMGLLWGPLHSSLGVEGSASAAIAALEKNDRLTATHRGHHHFLAKALRYHIPDNWKPLKVPDYHFLDDLITKTMAEILGLKVGFCGGRGGSMHLYYPEAGIHGTNGIVGGGIPAAAGLALASKMLHKNEVAVSFFGDGAINQGSFHEACNIAALWKLPVVFFIDNNQYAVGTKVEDACAVRRLAQEGNAYDIPCFTVKGNDLIAVYSVMKQAVDRARAGGGPSLIESIGYRIVHHDTEHPGSAYGYRTVQEEKEWEAREPIGIYITLLKNAGILSDNDLETLEARIDAVLDNTQNRLIADNQIRTELWPGEETVADGVRSDGSEFMGICFSEAPEVSAGNEKKYSQTIAKITGNWLKKDRHVVEWGEDIANFKFGPYGATNQLMIEFPDRVLNTPISESGFLGMALGAAMNGLKPIVEIMFPDFSLVAADQLFNQISKARHMYGGKVALPIVVRTRIAIGTGMGPQHSMDPTALFALFSGWRIVAPSNALDYIGLFNTAMTSQDPVLIVEHQLLYNKKYNLPGDDRWDYYIPFGKAKIARQGNDITVIAYGGTVLKVLQAAEEVAKHGISMEVIDLRSVDFSSIDYDTIVQSVKRTGYLVTVEESIKSQGIGSQINGEIALSVFDKLKAAPSRLSSMDVPISVSQVLEKKAILQEEDIVSFVLSGIWKGKNGN